MTFVPEDEKFETAQNKKLSDYDSYGTGNSNVIPVEKNGLWGLLDYSGNVLVEPTYSNFWLFPNNKGYTTFKDGAVYVIVDKNGVEVVRYDNVDDVFMCEDDIVCITRGCDVTYQHLNGAVIGSTQKLMEESFTEFSRFYTNEELATVFGDKENWCVDCATPYYEGTAYSIDELRLSWEEAGSFDVNGGYGDIECIATKNGKIANYYTYAVLNFRVYGYDEEGNQIIKKQKDVLFDFRKQWDNSWYNSIYDFSGLDELEYNAIYEEIEFNDYKYLAVYDKECFFIDLDGNIVSDTYLNISGFTPLGYAMVMEKEGMAHIVNDQFEIVETIENVEKFYTSNELFIITDLDGTIYSYYYNPNN